MTSPAFGLPPFPTTRLRRLRRWDWSRRLVREHHLRVEDLIWPVFLQEGSGTCSAVDSMPGVFRWPVDRLAEAAEEAVALGIPAMALFPMTPTEKKCPEGKEAVEPGNLVCQGLRAVKSAVGDRLGLICDVALDPYTSHGHDGLVREGYVVNDETVEVLVQQALNQARAGCDLLAPSDMMDGRVGRIRQALDAEGFNHVAILSYAAKYASAFYGPFRDAVGSAASLGTGDKKSYQMDPANSLEALRETALDITEGADLVMVKPGLPYLDIVAAVKQHFQMPTVVYQVSGEYSMIEAAIARGWLSERPAILESLLAFKRAGADAIISYFAPRVARWLAESAPSM